MLYIATVHFQTDKWIPIQLRYIKKHTKTDYKIFSCLPHDSEFKSNFYFYSHFEPYSLGSQNHADKLRHLVKHIYQEAQDDDILIFLDGDAFPIRDYVYFVIEKLKTYPLLAVRRDENNGDIHPHPSFCATTIGFWKQISGDWSPGFAWIDASGRFVTDTGGALLKQLGNKYNWLPLLRSNKYNLHPLWFGIYEDLVYHHGAGYREPVSRFDLMIIENAKEKDEDKIREDNRKLHETIFSRMLVDDDFYKIFTSNV